VAISESLLMLAGFVFAHATWSVSDLPEGELLVPLVIVENRGQRQLMRFEAETQAEAIAAGKAALAERGNEFDAWAFAREGQFKENGAYVDVLTIEAKTKDMKDPVVFIQRFQPYAKGKFKLIGEPIVALGGEVVSDDQAAELIARLRRGISTHKQAAELWPSWTSP
jgi:hypothetical protein